MLFGYRLYVNKRKASEFMVKVVDNFWTGIVFIILIVFLVVSAPFLLITKIFSEND